MKLMHIMLVSQYVWDNGRLTMVSLLTSISTVIVKVSVKSGKVRKTCYLALAVRGNMREKSLDVGMRLNLRSSAVENRYIVTLFEQEHTHTLVSSSN